MDDEGRRATRRYVLWSAASVALLALLALDVLWLSASGGAGIAQQRLLGVLALVACLYSQTELRDWHRYYQANRERAGCAPLPAYPRDIFGVRFLLDSVRQTRANDLLQARARALREVGRGHTFVHKLAPEPGFAVSTDEPEVVKAVLATRFDDWALPRVRQRAFRPVLGRRSIFQTNGPEWQHARAALRPAFVRDNVRDMACLDRHIVKLLARVRAAEGAPVDLQVLFAMLTMDSISDFMFGQSTDALGAAETPDALRFGQCFDRSMYKVANRARLGWLTQVLPDRELDVDTDFLRRYAAKYVEEAKRRTHNKEAAAEEGGGSGEKYVFLDDLIRSGEPDEVVRDQLLSIFLAGRDTTTSVLTFLFAQLARRPEMAAAIRREIRDLDLGPDPAAGPSWDQLRGMTYLNWAVREALRLNPPVATNSREAVRDTVLPTGGGPDGTSPTVVLKGTILRYQAVSTSKSMTPPFPSTTGPD